MTHPTLNPDVLTGHHEKINNYYDHLKILQDATFDTDLFDVKSFIDLKESILWDDRPLFFDNVLTNPSDWGSWEEIIDCGAETGEFHILYISREENGMPNQTELCNVKTDYQQRIKTNRKPIVKNSEEPKAENLWVNSPNIKTLLEDNKSIVITNFERKNKNCYEMIRFLSRFFYLRMRNHGIWPAQINSHSGHAHLYCGSAEAPSFPPHVDGPNNFIFQVEGESLFTVYENRQNSLSNLHAQNLNKTFSAERIDFLSSKLRVLEEKVMKPGDMVYVPSRVFHHVKPLTNRISVSFPLILKGPTSVML